MQYTGMDVKTVVHNGQTVNSWVHEGEVVYTSQRFTVTFKGSNGEVLKTESVPYGLSATPPEVDGYYEVEGYLYEIIGWDGDYTKVTQDITVSIKTSNVKMHTIVFVDWDENEISRCTVPYGDYSAIVTPENPEREGYTFSGWAMGAYNQPVVTWTATYEAKTYTIYFRVSELQEDSYATHTLTYKVGDGNTYKYYSLTIDEFEFGIAKFSIEAKTDQEIVFISYFNSDGTYAKSFYEDRFEVTPFIGTDPDDPHILSCNDVSESYTLRFKYNSLATTSHYETISYVVSGIGIYYTAEETIKVGLDVGSLIFDVTAPEGAEITILSIKSTEGKTVTPLDATYVVSSDTASTTHTIGYEFNDTYTLHFRCYALDWSYESVHTIKYRLNNSTGEEDLSFCSKTFLPDVDKDGDGYAESSEYSIDFSITAGEGSVIEFVSLETHTGLRATFNNELFDVSASMANQEDEPWWVDTVYNETKYTTYYDFTADRLGTYYLKYYLAPPNGGVGLGHLYHEDDLITAKCEVVDLDTYTYFAISAQYGSRIHIVKFYYGISGSDISFANTTNPHLVTKRQTLNLE